MPKPHKRTRKADKTRQKKELTLAFSVVVSISVQVPFKFQSSPILTCATVTKWSGSLSISLTTTASSTSHFPYYPWLYNLLSSTRSPFLINSYEATKHQLKPIIILQKNPPDSTLLHPFYDDAPKASLKASLFPILSNSWLDSTTCSSHEIVGSLGLLKTGLSFTDANWWTRLTSPYSQS